MLFTDIVCLKIYCLNSMILGFKKNELTLVYVYYFKSRY